MSPPDPSGGTNVSVIILAAGAGRRLGQGPKAHIALGDRTFLARVAKCCRDAGLEDLWVVGRSDDDRIEGAASTLGLPLVINTHPERGMSSSVVLGLEAVRLRHRLGVVVFPVDVPLVLPGTVRALERALHDGSDAWVRPVFQGRHGHPIAIGTGLVARLLARGASLPLRDALLEVFARPVDLDCDDEEVVAGVNLPGDLAAARARGLRR